MYCKSFTRLLLAIMLMISISPGSVFALTLKNPDDFNDTLSTDLRPTDNMFFGLAYAYASEVRAMTFTAIAPNYVINVGHHGFKYNPTNNITIGQGYAYGTSQTGTEYKIVDGRTGYIGSEYLDIAVYKIETTGGQPANLSEWAVLNRTNDLFGYKYSHAACNKLEVFERPDLTKDPGQIYWARNIWDTKVNKKETHGTTDSYNLGNHINLEDYGDFGQVGDSGSPKLYQTPFDTWALGDMVSIKSFQELGWVIDWIDAQITDMGGSMPDPTPTIPTADQSWQGSTSTDHWGDSTKWNYSAVPTSQNVVCIDNYVTTDNTARITSSTGTADAKALYIGVDNMGFLNQDSSTTLEVADELVIAVKSGSLGVYNMAGDLSAHRIYVGYDGFGLFNQPQQGTVDSFRTIIGYGKESTGKYALGQTGSTLNTAHLVVGAGGQGDFDHDDGVVNADFVTIGSYSKPDDTHIMRKGVYDMDGGTLNVDGDLTVGYSGWATLYVDDGDVVVGNSSATFDLDDGTASNNDPGNVGNLYVGFGYGSNGVVSQTGGSVDVEKDLVIGWNTGAIDQFEYSSGNYTADFDDSSTGSYILNNGDLNVDGDIALGISPTADGTFTQNGSSSSVTVGGSLNLSFHNGQTGGASEYQMNDGVLTITDSLSVGSDTGQGEFTQSGGSVTADKLEVYGNGKYTITDGNATFNGISGDINLDFEDGSTGVFKAGNSIIDLGTLTVNASASNSAEFEAYDNTVFILPSGSSLNSIFGYLSFDLGEIALVHNDGDTLTIDSTTGSFTVDGVFNDPLEVKDGMSFSVPTGKSLTLNNGLKVSGSSSVNLGEDSANSNLYINDTNFSQISAGSILGENVCIGYNQSDGQFAQSDGVVEVKNYLQLGGDTNSGEYDLSGGTLEVDFLFIYNGKFQYTGGTLDFNTLIVSTNGIFDIDEDLQLDGSVAVQAGGEIDVATGKTLTIAGGSISTVGGTINIDSDSTLDIDIDWTAQCEVNIEGGTLDMADDKTLTVSGDGQINFDSGTVNSDYLVLNKTGDTAVYQTADTHNAGHVDIKTSNNYSLTGGTLNIANGLTGDGQITFGNGSGQVVASGIIDLADLSLSTESMNTASFTVSDNSLLILPAGIQTPAQAFAGLDSYSFSSTATYYSEGSSLFLFYNSIDRGHGDINDFVYAFKDIMANAAEDELKNNSINLNAGVSISNNAEVHLGGGTVYINDTVSVISSGSSLTADAMVLGDDASAMGGIFTQNDNVTLNVLTIGTEEDSIYKLEAGTLTATDITLGDNGDGILRWNDGVLDADTITFNTASSELEINITSATNPEKDSLIDTTLVFESGTASTITMEVASALILDDNQEPETEDVDFTNNFAIDTLNLNGAKLCLVDLIDNQSDGSTDNEVMYVNTLSISDGSELIINGVALYYVLGDYDPLEVTITLMNGGSIDPVGRSGAAPEPATFGLLAAGAMMIMHRRRHAA